MCGIAGIHISKGGVDPLQIRRMADTLRHRGPDDEGYTFFNTLNGAQHQTSGIDTVQSLKTSLTPIDRTEGQNYNLALAHRRLSIIDLSSLGHQPMSYDNGNYWIVFNGEIFNYIEVRDELKERGHTFATRSDTEVILASYREWGTDCVTHFNGDWSFCIYDKGKNRLFASRDRYGVHFFYYYTDGSIFAFASEIKGLLALSEVNTGINQEQLCNFVVFGLFDYGEETSYRAIRQLKPGHNMVFDLATKNIRVYPYYELTVNPELGHYNDKESSRFADHIREILTDSVRIRLRADVPVGSCLSGGLDSSSIVMLINTLIKEYGISTENIGNHQKTFTAAYPNDTIDEGAYAREIIARADVDGKFTFPKAADLWRELGELMYHQEEPFGTTSVFAQWKVMQLSSQHVKVVLDGQGGDELFGGYGDHPAFVMSQGDWGLFRHRLKLYGSSALRELYLATGLKVIPAALKQPVVRMMRRKHLSFFQKVVPGLTDGINVRSVLGSTIDNVVAPNLNLRLWQEMTTYSIPQLLHYEDRSAMAFSIESRVPYLDYRLVDYVMAIPAVYKIHNGWSKWVFRLAMKGILPEAIRWRKDKLGFTTPEKKWLVDGENPFMSFVRKHRIPYDGDRFWWRLFLTSHWLERRGSGGISGS